MTARLGKAGLFEDDANASVAIMPELSHGKHLNEVMVLEPTSLHLN